MSRAVSKPVLPGTRVGTLGLVRKVRLGAEIVSHYGHVRWWLSRGTLPATVARTRRPSGRPVRPASDPSRTAVRLGRAVGRTLDRLPADSRCLMRSLVLTALLSRRGISSTLVIGTRSEPDFSAHAWVEVDGGAVLPDGSGEYGRILEI
jgi:hypothetical protein